MAGQLHELLNGPEDIPDAPRPLQINLSDADGGYGRFVLNHTEVLQSAQNLYLVGFFGQRRPGAGRIAIDEMDMTLQGEFGAYPAVLGYCTMRLSDGNYGNLVLISVDSVREHWRESTHHQYAAAELAPAYYASVRLHNALLRGGLKPGPDIQLARTKYYD